MKKRPNSIAPDLVSGAIIATGLLMLVLAIFEAIDNKAQGELLEPVPVINSHYPPVPDCAHLYDQGMHTLWADCMGVGYK